MQDKRDQVQAHLFIMGRMASAMLRAEPDDPESPSGRTNRGAAIGVIIAVLVCAGAFVFGLIMPGGKDSWRTSGELIIDKTTGSNYLFLDGRLRPVRNYASARLILGSDLKSTTVLTKSLGDTPHGTPIGIPGAPAGLPGTGDLDTTPWQVCAGVRPQPAGSVTVTTTLAIGVNGGGDTPGVRKLGSADGLLISRPDGTMYLLWQGTRLRIEKATGAIDALGYGAVVPRPASEAFINAFPQGLDLAPPAVLDRGAAGPALGGLPTKIGQVFRVDQPGSASQYHLLMKEGLVPLTATEMALVLGDPRTRAQAYGGAAASVRTIGVDALTGHLAPRESAKSLARLPATPPKAVELASGSVACADVDFTGGTTRIGTSVMPAFVLDDVVQPPAREVEPACLKVDAITVKPGKGALVRALSAGGTGLGDTTFLVTDEGVKYRVSSQEAVDALGFKDAKARGLPAQMLSMLPTGPDLTPEAAARGEAKGSLRCDSQQDK
ncbi:type VII secretion protein EccB [Streptomyces sp. NPDC060022]|uniref:type VII secretion protein EccB n=1 Tax=Streptomyces sp. NPDC060022 TaxID=3347039 RepID=UPI00369B58F4